MSTQPSEAQPQEFDPRRGIITIPGKGKAAEYLPVNWRVYWLRQEHPEAQVVTEIVQVDEAIAIFKATVTLANGAVATGFGSQTPRQFPSYVEKAETKAIGRALALLGYGTLAAFLEDEDGQGLADAPVERPRPVQRIAPQQANAEVFEDAGTGMPAGEFATLRATYAQMCADGVGDHELAQFAKEQSELLSPSQLTQLRRDYKTLVEARRSQQPPAPTTPASDVPTAHIEAIKALCALKHIPQMEALAAEGLTGLDGITKPQAARVVAWLQTQQLRPQGVSA